MSIIPVPLDQAEPKQGVVFWWSNILRGYQLRFYPPADAPEPSDLDLARLPLIYLSRAEVETAAITLARHFGVDIYEIQVPRINGAANDNSVDGDTLRFEGIDALKSNALETND